MKYQFEYSMRGDELTVMPGENVTYQPHLHNSFEYVTVGGGEIEIWVEKTCYVLKKGDSLLIFPNQVHEFKTQKTSATLVCIFSPELVITYAPVYEKKIPISNLFKSDRNYGEELLGSDKKSIMSAQGVLYSLCGEFHDGADYIDKPSRNTALIEEIFKYIENNFHSVCTLKTLSQYTSYNYVYLSRYFKESTGISFIDYLNKYRINKACYELKNSNKTVLRVAYDSGFDSLRNFNRVFKKITGETPGEYRIQKSK